MVAAVQVRRSVVVVQAGPVPVRRGRLALLAIPRRMAIPVPVVVALAAASGGLGAAILEVPARPARLSFKGHEHAYIYSDSRRQGALEVPG